MKRVLEEAKFHDSFDLKRRNEKYPAGFENLSILSDVSIHVCAFFDSFFETRGEGKEKYYVISTLRLCKDVSQGQLEKVTSSFYIPGIIREGVADRLGRNTKRWNWKYEDRRAERGPRLLSTPRQETEEEEGIISSPSFLSSSS